MEQVVGRFRTHEAQVRQTEPGSHFSSQLNQQSGAPLPSRHLELKNHTTASKAATKRRGGGHGSL